MASRARRPPSLVAQTSYLASQVSKYGRRHLEGVLRDHGLVLIHHAVLSTLGDLGPLSQQELADSLDIHKSHLVAPIDALERRKLVTRTRDRSDRRRNEVTLTAAGRALVRELRPAARASERGFLEALSDEERETLASLLRRVLDANDSARLAAGADTAPPPTQVRAR